MTAYCDFKIFGDSIKKLQDQGLNYNFFKFMDLIKKIQQFRNLLIDLTFTKQAN